MSVNRRFIAFCVICPVPRQILLALKAKASKRITPDVCRGRRRLQDASSPALGRRPRCPVVISRHARDYRYGFHLFGGESTRSRRAALMSPVGWLSPPALPAPRILSGAFAARRRRRRDVAQEMPPASRRDWRKEERRLHDSPRDTRAAERVSGAAMPAIATGSRFTAKQDAAAFSPFRVA